MTTARRTQKQNTRYWALIARLPHMDDAARRSITLAATGHVSTKDLSVSEMNGLCQHLEMLLGERRKEDVEYPNEVSHAQASAIARLAHEMGWDPNPARLEGFLLRQTGGRVKEVKDLTRLEAQKVLNGLAFMLKREKASQVAGPMSQV